MKDSTFTLDASLVTRKCKEAEAGSKEASKLRNEVKALVLARLVFLFFRFLPNVKTETEAWKRAAHDILAQFENVKPSLKVSELTEGEQDKRRAYKAVERRITAYRKAVTESKIKVREYSAFGPSSAIWIKASESILKDANKVLAVRKKEQQKADAEKALASATAKQSEYKALVEELETLRAKVANQ